MRLSTGITKGDGRCRGSADGTPASPTAERNFYDLCFSHRMYPLQEERLVNAILTRPSSQRTAVEAEPIWTTLGVLRGSRAICPVARLPEPRRSRFGEGASDLWRLVARIEQFALPVLSAIAAGPFKALWKPGGHRRLKSRIFAKSSAG